MHPHSREGTGVQNGLSNCVPAWVLPVPRPPEVTVCNVNSTSKRR